MPPQWLRHLSYKSFQNTWPAKRAVESFLISKFQFLTQIILLQKPSKVKTDLRKRDENENRFRKRQDFHLCVFTANLAKTKTKTAMFINLAVLTFVFRETRKNTLVKILRFTKTVFIFTMSQNNRSNLFTLTEVLLLTLTLATHSGVTRPPYCAALALVTGPFFSLEALTPLSGGGKYLTDTTICSIITV